MARFATFAAGIAIVCVVAHGARGGAASEGTPIADPGIARAWAALRAVDCARCHGKHYDGLAAPSIVRYARTQSRQMFLRAVLDGNPPHGMPAYRDNQSIAARIEDIYRYFLGRSNGTIDADWRPESPQSQQGLR